MCVEVCNRKDKDDDHDDSDDDHDEKYGSCYENQQCRRDGLTGACCPTKDNVYLECCSGKSEQPKEARCSRNDKCKAKDLEGYCCVSASSMERV